MLRYFTPLTMLFFDSRTPRRRCDVFFALFSAFRRFQAALIFMPLLHDANADRRPLLFRNDVSDIFAAFSSPCRFFASFSRRRAMFAIFDTIRLPLRAAMLIYAFAERRSTTPADSPPD